MADELDQHLHRLERLAQIGAWLADAPPKAKIYVAARLAKASALTDQARCQGLLNPEGTRRLVNEAQAIMDDLERWGLEHVARVEQQDERPSGALSEPARAAPQNEFRKINDRRWALSFEDKRVELQLPRGLLGMTYISALLSSPNRDIRSTELRSLVAEGTRVLAPIRTREQLSNDSLRVGLGDAGEYLDQDAILSYRARLKEIAAERERAEHDTDVAVADRQGESGGVAPSRRPRACR